MPSVFINEFHYDNAGTDVNEFVEIAASAGTNLTGYSIVLYNGNGGAPYATLPLSGTIADMSNGFGFVSVSATGLQNGAPDGIALVGPGDTLIEFLSYEGTFTAVGGPANGVTSTSVGVVETGGSAEPAGLSLQRQGTGDDSTDFAFAGPIDDTPGALNAGQTFTSGGTPVAATVSIADASVSEGDAGTKLLTFTVTRSDTAGAFTVDFATADGTATAGSDYAEANGTLAFAAGGPATQTISVVVNGDTVSEPNEALTVTLSNLQSTSGTATLADATATGTIVNDEPTRIFDVQGAGHRSALVGQQVTVRGIVTAIDGVGTENGGNNPVGYYIQERVGDGDYRTSDAVFVFLGTGANAVLPAEIAVGNEVQLTATVSEFASGSQLSTTQLNPVAGTTSVISTGNALPTAVRVGDTNDLTTGLERKPALVSLGDDDGDATPEVPSTYDPVNQGSDFWESLEGMRVTLDDVRVTTPFRSNFDEQFVTPNVGPNPSDNSRGGLTIRDTTPGTVQPADKVFDLNPERIQLDDEAGITLPTGLQTGDRLGDVTGVVNYANSQYEVNTTEAYGAVTRANLPRETTAIAESFDRIRIASFNVENLAPVGQPVDNVPTDAAKYAGLAAAIVNNLRSPEILALQEVLDNDGAANTAATSAADTLATLIQAIVDAGGPRYTAIDSPPVDDTVGGIPGGNQRVAYLFNPEAVSPTARNGLTPVSGTPDGITVLEAPTQSQIGQGNPDFTATRKSLPIEWSPVGYTDAQGGTFHTVNNHLSSKGGSAPLYGTNLDLPLYADPLNGSAQATSNDPGEREGQAEAINAYVDGILANASSTDDRIVVLGDLNDFQFFPVVDLITGQVVRTQANPDGTPSVFEPGTPVLAELADKLPAEERYSYNFDGNAQALDHILVSNELFETALFDIVHINSEFADQISDHDPSLASLLLARSAAIATAGDDLFDEAVYTATFGARRGSLAGDDIVDGLGGNDTIASGAGNDALVGGAGDDELAGGAGDDTLDGGADAADTAILSGTRSNYVVEDLGGNTFRFTDTRGEGADGVDRVTGVELFRFSDRELSAAQLGDTAAPTLSSSSPADNATGVARNATIVLTFDEAVQAGAGTITLTNGAGDTREIAVNDPQVAFSGNTLTVDPTAELVAGTSYDVIVPSAAVTDAAGNAFAGIAQDGLDFTVENAPVVNFTLQILHASDFEAGLDAIDRAGNFAAIVDYLEDTRANSITLSSGDNFLPSPFFNAGSDPSLKEVYETALEDHYDLAPGTLNITPGLGTADISMLNIIGVEASAIGNHEFDAGTNALAALIRQTERSVSGTPTPSFPGAQFPYLSANLDFSGDANLNPLFTSEIRDAEDFAGFPPAAGIGKKIAPAAIINENGERIGVVGATTQIVESISSTGGVEVIGDDENDMAELAAILQPTIDALRAQGIDKIILTSHLQQLALEKQLAPLLSGVDVIIAGGSHTLLADGEDASRGLQPGDTAAETYAFVTQNADGDTTLIVNTAAEYSYVGRLVVEFDAAGKIVPGSVDPNVSGAFATTDDVVADLYATPIDIDGDGDLDGDPFVSGSRGDLVNDIAQGVGGVIAQQDANTFGRTAVYLEGRRGEVRTEETNLGNLTADANLAYAQAVDETVLVSIKNGGGIRDSIGSIDPDPNNPEELPPAANPEAGKEEGEISQLDIANSLRFNNTLSLITVTPEQLVQVLEHAVRATAPGATPGQFAQVGGIAYSFDADLPAGERVVSAALTDENGEPARAIVRNGRVVADAPGAIRLVTLSFLLTGGDGYPFQSFVAQNPAFADVVDLAPENVPDGGAATFAAEGTEQDALAEYLAANFATTPFGEADTGAAADERIQNLDFRSDTVLDGVPVTGGPGSDTQVGGAGDEVFEPGSGDDMVIAGGGNDRVEAGSGDDFVQAGDGDDAVLAGSGDDHVLGGGGNDYVDGESGADVILGGGGNDQLNGGSGDDYIAGEEGNDVLVGASGDDHLSGGAGNDFLGGDAGGDVLLGGDGSDQLNGGSGEDFLGGGTGRDVLVGGAGGDRMNGGAENDVMTGENGNDFLVGEDGDDVLLGDANADRLEGGAGADILVGGSGDDDLFGGAGDDRFVFDTRFGRDTIFGFGDSEGNQDVIEFSRAVFVDIADVRDSSRQVGGDLVITGDRGDILTIQGTTFTAVQDDFAFV